MKTHLTLVLLAALTLAGLSLGGCQAATDKVTDMRDGKSEARSSAEAETPVIEDKRKRVEVILDVNTVERFALMQAPGVTKGMADLILDGRPYHDMLELDDDLDMDGLSEHQRKVFYKSAIVLIDLNQGTTEDINFIPNMSRKLVHRIESGRPYADMAAFETMLTKYLKPEQAARLAQYFTITPTAE